MEKNKMNECKGILGILGKLFGHKFVRKCISSEYIPNSTVTEVSGRGSSFVDGLEAMAIKRNKYIVFCERCGKRIED